MLKSGDMLPDTNVLLRYLLRDDTVQFAKGRVF